MFRSILTAPLLLPFAAFAKDGDESTSKPKSTKTTQQCGNGKVWDNGSKSCVSTQSELLDDDTLFGAVREFAYAGQLDHAQAALRAMSDQTEDRVLTYWGFTTRKLGDMEGGMRFYAQALEQNPGNITARSYMGQALVEQGDLVGARKQLLAIRELGGAGTWAEQSLETAVLTGTTYNY